MTKFVSQPSERVNSILESAPKDHTFRASPKSMRVDRIVVETPNSTDIFFSDVTPGIVEAGIIQLTKLFRDYGTSVQMEFEQCRKFIPDELQLHDDVLRFINPLDCMYCKKENEREFGFVSAMMTRIAKETIVNQVYRVFLFSYLDSTADEEPCSYTSKQIFKDKLESILELLR